MTPAHPLAGAWQPIETAPKDGRRVMLYGYEFRCHWFGIGYYFKGVSGDGAGWIAWAFYTAPENDSGGAFTPTHWQPLPDPPAAEASPREIEEGEQERRNDAR